MVTQAQKIAFRAGELARAGQLTARPGGRSGEELGGATLLPIWTGIPAAPITTPVITQPVATVLGEPGVAQIPRGLGEIYAAGIPPAVGAALTAAAATGISALTGWATSKLGGANGGVAPGGGAMAMTLPFVPRGPGVPEPPRELVAKEWSIVSTANDIGVYRVWFWRLIDGRITCYNPRSGLWKIWRPVKHIILPKGRRGMSMNQFLRADRYLEKFTRRLIKRSKRLKAQ